MRPGQDTVALGAVPARAQRVLILTGSLRIGGAERQSVVLANGFTAAGLEVSFGYVAPEDQLLGTLPPAVRARSFCLGKAGRLDLRILFRLRHWLARLQPDVVICVNPYPLLLAWITRLGLWQRRPVLMPVVHATLLEPGAETLMVRRILGPVLGRPWVRPVFLSHAQVGVWRRHYGLRSEGVRVIYNGVDPQWFTPRESAPGRPGQRVLAVCAALRPEKRHLDFLRAVEQLVGEGFDLHALLIGDGPERARIEAWCREHGLGERCQITGFQMDVRPWLASADICLLTSSTETFPMALLEAMSMARPVVAPAVGGIPEQVADGVSGLLVPAGDPGALADALRRLLRQDAEQLRAMGEAGRQRVLEHFCEDRMLAEYLAALQDIGQLP